MDILKCPKDENGGPKRITNFDAFISIIKASVGIACLEMPTAFCDAGYLVGLIGTYIIGAVSIYSITVLISSMNTIKMRYTQRCSSYAECLRIAIANGPKALRRFSHFAKLFVNALMALYSFGVCCIYILFIADNLKQVGDLYFESINFELYVIGLTTPLVLIFLIRSIKNLVPLSMFANILLILSLGAILAYTVESLPPLSERKMFNSWKRLPLFFGTVLFSMESIGTILVIESEMKRPEDYLGLTGIFTLGSFFTLTIYAIFGFFGYWRFGCESKGSITLNMPTNTTFSKLIKLSLALSIYVSYALQAYVIIDILWNQYLVDYFEESDRCIMELNTRCFIVLFSIFAAVISPDISIFLPFLGAFCISILAFVLPGFIDICLHYADGYGFSNKIVIRGVLLIIFGAIGAVMGTWAAWVDLKAYYNVLEPQNNQSLLYYSYISE